jgi:hypothetical protein
MSNLIYSQGEVMASADPIVSDEACIVQTDNQRDLVRIRSWSVQAVIYVPRALPDWFLNLAAAVENGALEVPRTTLHNVTHDEVKMWVEVNVSTTRLCCEVLNALKTDIMELVDCLAGLTNARRFSLRIFTGAPTTDCGFHVDTVPPGAPRCGLLRVYNGVGTAYVEPANVTSTRDFYHYLSRRERLERERAVARRNAAFEDCERLEREIKQLDLQPGFLKHRSQVQIAPAGSIVAFKHLDISRHWSNHGKELAWIHCSPMQGNPRLVINISSPQPVQRRTGWIAP